ncbi:hypothetical protein FSB08_07410 [Paraburkholderia sp. JPY432]|nr:hypothetical protein [Paraburkholderia youngii]
MSKELRLLANHLNRTTKLRPSVSYYENLLALSYGALRGWSAGTQSHTSISILAEVTAAKKSVLLPAILRVERGKTEKELTNDTAINARHLTWLDDA